jgi:hypothetical protein
MPVVALHFQNPGFIPDDPPHGLIGLIWIFLQDPLSNYVYAHRAASLVVCLFHQCNLCHIHMGCYRHIVSSFADLFLVWFS